MRKRNKKNICFIYTVAEDDNTQLIRSKEKKKQYQSFQNEIY